MRSKAMPYSLRDELSRQFLCAFTAMGKPGSEASYINANLYGRERVRVRMRGAEMEMTREEFLAFCREGIRALEKV